LIHDLKQIGNDEVTLATQVCVIGAGTAGIFIAQDLCKLGVNVLLLESGDRVIRRPSETDEKCFQLGIPYKGAEMGRGFGLGGTSSLWGGQMIPISPSDMEKRATLSLDAWPINYSELLPYFNHVKKSLGLNTKHDDISFNQKYFSYLSNFSNDFQLKIGDWIPFKNRNFSQAFANELINDDHIEVWLNSVVTKFEVNDKLGKISISNIQAKSPNGKILNVEAKYIVICAGALESTRLILNLDESSNGLISKTGSPLGRYFSDHLSMTVGKIQCWDWHKFNSQMSPVFYAGLMRSPRLELSSSSQQKYSLTSAFIHFPFVTQGDTGFDLIRNWLRKQQGEQIKSNVSAIPISQIIPDTFSLLLWRGIYDRLWIPRQSDLFLQVDIEQIPNWNSRLSLSDDFDSFGRKKLIIDWKISPEDIRVFKTVANLAKEAWDSSSLNNFAQLELTLNHELGNLESIYDVYHPTGSLRMGTSPQNSVVDSNLKLWALENCFVSSTAVFPTAGSANPGLTHLALTARLAQHIYQHYR
jgi:hypothetical protein